MTIAFTGHRNFDHSDLKIPLIEVIKRYITEEETIFLSGMAIGFDLAAAEAVISLSREFKNIQLICVVPYADQSKFFSESDRARYSGVLESADEVVILESEYSKMVFHHRNDYLVESADMIIAYYDRAGKGGTAYTVRRAKQKRVALLNLYPEAQLSLF